jgi:hypothetical protein
MRLARLLGYSTLVLFSLVLATRANGQVQPSPYIPGQYFDVNGRPLAGGCICTYVSGTTTPLATFSDAAGSVPNTNPVQLDSAGRARLFLQGQAYTLKLYAHGTTNNCATSLGPIQWSIDGINPSANSILGGNNVWSGTNTFNGATTFNGSVTMNSGFTSNGPSNMTAGGSMAGTFSGSPSFSGFPSFTGGFASTTGTFSGQITSTVASGTAPFVIASTTVVANLNASSVNGCTFAIPCPLGSTTPNTVAATTLTANSFTLNGAGPFTAVVGLDTKLVTGVALTGPIGSTVCKDTNGGVTTVGCAGGFTQIQAAVIASPCTPPSSSSYDACNSTVTWPVAFADTSYIVSCTALGTGYNGGAPGSNNSNFIYARSKATGSASITVQNGRGAADTPTEIDCIGVHP